MTNGTDELEARVRDLLERATPELSAPADRLSRVRDRVVRRRRRRTAAVGAAGVAVVGVLVSSALPIGAPRDAVSATPAFVPTYGTPSPAASAERTVRYPELGDLTLWLPEGWDGSMTAAGGHGYAKADGAVLEVTLYPEDRFADRMPDLEETTPLEETALETSCRAEGGQASYTATFRPEPAPGNKRTQAPLIAVRLCLAAGAEGRLTEAERILDVATFGDADAAPVPRTPERP